MTNVNFWSLSLCWCGAIAPTSKVAACRITSLVVRVLRNNTVTAGISVALIMPLQLGLWLCRQCTGDIIMLTATGFCQQRQRRSCAILDCSTRARAFCPSCDAACACSCFHRLVDSFRSDHLCSSNNNNNISTHRHPSYIYAYSNQTLYWHLSRLLLSTPST